MADTTILQLAGAVLLILAIAISVVDLRSLRIPDGLNVVLAIGGLGFQIAAERTFPLLPLIGGIGLLLAFYTVRQVYLRQRGVVGLGLGDVKMAGASALWLHPASLPLFVFLSSATALLSVLLLGRCDRRFQTSGRLPFGPFLAAGLIASWCLENIAGVNLWSS